MSRINVLARNPKRTLAGLTVAIVAAGVAVGSGADFSASSANPSNAFSSGTLKIANDKEGQSILTASNWKIGDTKSGTVKIQNTGSLAGKFSLSESTPTDADGKHLAGQLDLTVVDCAGDSTCATSTPVYSGKLNAMPTENLVNFAANDIHYYKFTVTLPSTGTNAGDNAYQGAATSVDFNWATVQA